MHRIHRSLLPALLLLAACLCLPAWAQDKPPMSVVSIYHVAPGKHMDFLKWMAAREAIDKEAGVAPTQWYAHTDGDSWDYVGISPDIDDAMSQKVEELSRSHGVTVGPKAGIELRQLIASHTDTFAVGPISASELIQRINAP